MGKAEPENEMSEPRFWRHGSHKFIVASGNDVKHHSGAEADDRQGEEEGEGNAVGNVQSVLKCCCTGVLPRAHSASIVATTEFTFSRTNFLCGSVSSQGVQKSNLY